MLLRDSLGYNPNPAIVLVVRAPGGGRLDTEQPRGAPRGRPAQPRHGAGRIRRPCRQPAARPPRRRRADRPRRRIAGDRRLPLDRRPRGRRRHRRRRRRTAGRLELARRRDGRLRRRLQRDQRPDPNGPDQGRADRLPDPRPAAAVRLPRRRRRLDPAADRGASRSSARCSCCGSCRASPTPRSSPSTSPPGSASAWRSTTRC